jgi:hypothetical protein
MVTLRGSGVVSAATNAGGIGDTNNIEIRIETTTNSTADRRNGSLPISTPPLSLHPG